VALQAGAAAIRALQRELGERGHEAGAIDGFWGENTRQALRDFQREHDLESTGTLTLPTLAALGVTIARQDARTQGDFDAVSSDRPAQEEDEDAVATTQPED
jgi:peptidoglycan hydrolase-like protein with peptidoglycan-binding domain